MSHVSDDAVFSAEQHDEPGRTLFRVAGEIDLASAPELEALLTAAVDAGVEEILVDLSGVDFLDSVAMGLLVNAFIRQARRRRRLVLVEPSLRARRTLEVAGLLGVFPIVPADAAA